MNQQFLGPHSLTINLSPDLYEYLEAAITRLRLHFPSLAFFRNGDGIVIYGDTGIDPELLRSAVHHIVFREKIASEMRLMRQSQLVE